MNTRTMSFDLTEHKPTVQMSTEELVEKFTRAAQTGWSESKLPDAQAPHNGEHQPFEVVTSYSFDETILQKKSRCKNSGASDAAPVRFAVYYGEHRRNLPDAKRRTGGF